MGWIEVAAKFGIVGVIGRLLRKEMNIPLLAVHVQLGVFALDPLRRADMFASPRKILPRSHPCVPCSFWSFSCLRAVRMRLPCGCG